MLVDLLKKAFEWDGIWLFLGIRFSMLLISLFIDEHMRVLSGLQGWLWALFIAFAVTYPR